MTSPPDLFNWQSPPRVYLIPYQGHYTRLSLKPFVFRCACDPEGEEDRGRTYHPRLGTESRVLTFCDFLICATDLNYEKRNVLSRSLLLRVSTLEPWTID